MTPTDDWADDVPADWTRTRRGWLERVSTAATAAIVLLPAGGAAGYWYGQSQQPEPKRVLVPVTAKRCATAVQGTISDKLDKLNEQLAKEYGQ